MAVDDRLDRPLLARVEAVANLLMAIEPVREQAAGRRGHAWPALLTPAGDLACERGRQRQFSDVLNLPLEVLDR